MQEKFHGSPDFPCGLSPAVARSPPGEFRGGRILHKQSRRIPSLLDPVENIPLNPVVFEYRSGESRDAMVRPHTTSTVGSQGNW